MTDTAEYGHPPGAKSPSLTALSPAERALLRYLTDRGGEADSLAVRRDLGVANVSATARAVSLKFAAAGDPRRVECVSGSTVDPATGRLRSTARWRLVDLQPA